MSPLIGKTCQWRKTNVISNDCGRTDCRIGSVGTFRVHNTGPQPHEVQLVQLAPGASLGDFMKWLEKMEGPPPGKPLGGFAAAS